MKLLGLLALLVATPLLTGCGGGPGSGDGRPSVVVSFYPLQYVAERVAGEHADVSNLTSPGAEPHDLELSVPKTVEVADADLAFYQHGFQPAVDDSIEQNGPERVVEVTEVVQLEGGDPHFWLDPVRLSDVAVAFEKEMAEVDPEHAVDYGKNLAALQSDLATLDESYRAGLASCDLGTVVVSHDAFGYLSAYGLDFESINGLSPDAEPSPEHIAELHDLIDSEGITTVFSETQASKQMADTIAGDLGITTAVLDPIEGLSDATADQDYLSLMRQNLAVLQKANRC